MRYSIPAPVEDASGCLLWQGSKTWKGYGRKRIRARGGEIHAHRLAYETRYGPIPSGLFVLHRCDTRACVNPDHLFLGTAKDNTADAKAKGRLRGNTTCGESKPQAKLTAIQVQAIRSEAAVGARLASLARKYGVSRSTIARIVQRRIWSHL